MDVLRSAIDGVVPVVEAAGALVVLAGIAIALFRMVRVPFAATPPRLVAIQIRLGLGLSLALGLEFLLAADILRTAVSPTFTEIGQLAAIVAIRTALNFFLGRELVEGRRQMEALSAVHLNHSTIGPPRAKGSFVARALRGPRWLVEEANDEQNGNGTTREEVRHE